MGFSKSPGNACGYGGICIWRLGVIHTIPKSGGNLNENILVNGLTSRAISSAIRMKMLVLYAPEKRDLKQPRHLHAVSAVHCLSFFNRSTFDATN
ncbi:hypothetical protein GC207_08505 [bacterium]|nr:hypothetical protein [bacterium]